MIYMQNKVKSNTSEAKSVCQDDKYSDEEDGTSDLEEASGDMCQEARRARGLENE